MDTGLPSSSIVPSKSRNQVIFVTAGILILLLYIVLNVGVWQLSKMKNSPQTNQTTPQPQNGVQAVSLPTPTPLPLTSAGMYEFTVSGGGGKGPKLVTKGVLDPVDPPVGGKQKFTITTVDGATNVSALLKTDTKEKEITLEKDPTQPNTWKGVWVMDDQYSYIYTLYINGQVNGQDATLPMTFR